LSVLTIYREDDAGEALEQLTDPASIAQRLAHIGVQFKQWQAGQPLAADADQDAVLAAYRNEVNKLNTEYGFQSMDVVSLRPDNPKAAEMRQLFLAEHTHADFEVRFFVDGSGLFYLHAGGKVYLMLCQAGDLISVPANTTHWFDMGTAPSFKCIRFFTTPEGWQGDFSGSDIASRFPDYDAHLTTLNP
jgi:1,2-dihydroxy-3-keto-5-methylthiopentene dioxygenase